MTGLDSAPAIHLLVAQLISALRPSVLMRLQWRGLWHGCVQAAHEP